MSYEVYKVMHIVTLFLFFAGMGSIFLGGANSRVVKIMTGVSSLLILVGGMGLIARIGIKHGESWLSGCWRKLRSGYCWRFSFLF